MRFYGENTIKTNKKEKVLMHLMTNLLINGNIIVFDYNVHGVKYCSDAVLLCRVVLSAFYEHNSRQ